jgi:hypothetical protein
MPWSLTSRRINPKPFFIVQSSHCEGDNDGGMCRPSIALGVVGSRQFDMRWISTPRCYFLHRRRYALHFGGVGRRARKAANTVNLISACGSVFNITAACEGPVFALWVVVAAHFDLRCKATPHVFFLALT